LVKEFHERVLFEEKNRVAVITLNRPERLNAFDAGMYSGVNEALETFRDNPELWVAIIQASGDVAFSAGADIKALNELAQQGSTASLGGLLFDTEMVTNKPIIAAVHGHCVGEGINLVLCCDMVFADESANFMISEPKVGTNAVDIPIKLAKKLGYPKAFAFLTPGDGKDAAWCERAGLVEVVTPVGEVQEQALAFAIRIVEESGPLAIRAQKETLWLSVFEDDIKAKEKGTAMRLAIRRSSDYAEGRAAFLEKRKPHFKGA
jgi:enoyl-CoA hydratase/carnithine racemase